MNEPVLGPICKPNPFGLDHCFHESGFNFGPRAPGDLEIGNGVVSDVSYNIVVDQCCWCGGTKEKKHGTKAKPRPVQW